CLRYFADVATTLDNLHTRRVIHGGINPSDILLLDGHAKIADFGPMPDGSGTVKVPLYKSICMAPELSLGHAMPESDQYALAATYAWVRLGHDALTIPRRGELPDCIDIGRLPEGERKVLGVALNREPKQRFASCHALIEALAQLV